MYFRLDCINCRHLFFKCRVIVGSFTNFKMRGRMVSCLQGCSSRTPGGRILPLLSFLLISSAFSLPFRLPLHDCPYYETLYHSLFYAVAWMMKFLGSIGLRASPESKPSPSSLPCVSCVERRLVSNRLFSWTAARTIITSSTAAHPWLCNSRRLVFSEENQFLNIARD